MKNMNGFAMSYNPQTAVDSATHLIRDFEMTNHVTNHGLLYPTMEGIREETPGEIMEAAEDPDSIYYGTPGEMQERGKEGYFVRYLERNLLYCPSGEILRRKCIKKNGNIRYANKNACRHCSNRNKCYKGKGEWKEVDFTKDSLEKLCRGWQKAEGKEDAEVKRASKIRYEKVKAVKSLFKPCMEKCPRGCACQSIRLE